MCISSVLSAVARVSAFASVSTEATKARHVRPGLGAFLFETCVLMAVKFVPSRTVKPR
jgi:hypothetical protein